MRWPAAGCCALRCLWLDIVGERTLLTAGRRAGMWTLALQQAMRDKSWLQGLVFRIRFGVALLMLATILTMQAR